MRTSNRGLVELVGHEGICLSKYKDSVGVWTIGIGATRSEIPDLASWPLDKKITMQEAFELLRTSIVKYENAINKALKKDILQHQFDALVSWCYNVGVGYTQPVYDKKGNMARDKATVLKLINGEASSTELHNALMMFKKPKEIIDRRLKEASLLAYGRYSNDGKALLFPVSSKGYPIYSRGISLNVWEHIESASEKPLAPLVVKKSDEKALETRPSIIKTILNSLFP